MISVNMVDANVYQVIVEGVQGAGDELDSGITSQETVHRVHMSQEHYRELCGATVTHEWVLIQAFKFLLQREPNTAILAEFDLRDVSGYFPEFEEELKALLSQ